MRPIFLVIVPFLLFSCVDGGKSPSKDASSTSDTVNTAAADNTRAAVETPADSAARKMMMSSVMRYAIDSKEFSPWGSLLQQSKWAKQVHNGQYTFLCPTADAVKNHGIDIVALLKLEENKDLLDRVMAKHLLAEPLNRGKIMDMTEVKTIDGKSLTVDKLENKVGGVSVTDREISTDHGVLLVIGDIIDFPQDELEAQAKKRTKANMKK